MKKTFELTLDQGKDQNKFPETFGSSSLASAKTKYLFSLASYLHIAFAFN